MQNTQGLLTCHESHQDLQTDLQGDMDMDRLGMAALEGLVMPNAHGQPMLVQLGFVKGEGNVLLARDGQQLEAQRLQATTTLSQWEHEREVQPHALPAKDWLGDHHKLSIGPVHEYNNNRHVREAGLSGTGDIISAQCSGDCCAFAGIGRHHCEHLHLNQAMLAMQFPPACS